MSGAAKDLFGDEAALLALAGRIAAQEGLDRPAPIVRFSDGSLPVYAIGREQVLKLYPADEAGHATIESRTLALLHGKLPVPTPALLASRAIEADGAPLHYLLMSRLHGQPMVQAWPALSQTQRDALADMLGESVAALHAIDAAPVADFEPHWPGFAQAQHASATERQRKRGLAPEWADRIAAYLDRWGPAPAARHVLLHTEIMREHLLVRADTDGARLSGLFDFEPAMIGPPEYDFASIGLFCACGDARFFTRVLRAYGYARSELNAELQCRFMAYALLHRYSNLRWYLQRLPAGDADSLERLAQRWWPLEP